MAVEGRPHFDKQFLDIFRSFLWNVFSEQESRHSEKLLDRITNQTGSLFRITHLIGRNSFRKSTKIGGVRTAKYRVCAGGSPATNSEISFIGGTISRIDGSFIDLGLWAAERGNSALSGQQSTPGAGRMSSI